MTVTIVGGASSASSASASRSLPRGLGAMCIGPSYMSTGHAIDGGTKPAEINNNSPLALAVALSGGKMYLDAPAGNDAAAATGGYTAQQIIDNHLPEVEAHKPAICVVGPLVANGAPANNSTAENAAKAQMREVIERLQAEDILPVVISEFPNGGGTPDFNRTRFHSERWNEWLRRYAHSMRVPYADAWKGLVDPASAGKYLPTMSDDGLHQRGLGSQVVGQSVVDALATILAQVPPVPLAQANETYDPVTGGGRLTNINPLNLAGAGAGVLPTGWATTGGFGTVDSAEAATRGNWLKATGRTAAEGGDSTLTFQSNALQMSTGDRMFLTFRYRVAGFAPEPGLVAAALRLFTQDSGLGCGVAMTRNGEGVYAGEFTWTNSGGSTNRFLGAAPAGVTLSVAQVTLMNLTTQRIIPV